jgi:nucleoside-diphosphate-sugar epimerase
VIKSYICGNGFLGTELSKDFNENGRYLVSPQFSELKRPQNLNSSQLKLISDEFHQQKNSIFINASGPSSVQESFHNNQVALEQPTQQVLKHIELLSSTETPILYVYISSAAVYGETPKLGIKEDGYLNPMSPYAEGKMRAEEALKLLAQNINPLVSIITLRVFSAYSENLLTRILHKIVVDAKKNKHIDLAGDGSESRDFTHSSDISRVIKFLMEKGEQEGQIFNVGTGEGMEIRELMEIADAVYKNIYNGPLDYSFNGSKRIGDPSNLVANIEKLINLGFKPAVSPYRGLELYFRKNFNA